LYHAKSNLLIKPKESKPKKRSSHLDLSSRPSPLCVTRVITTATARSSSYHILSLFTLCSSRGFGPLKSQTASSRCGHFGLNRSFVFHFFPRDPHPSHPSLTAMSSTALLALFGLLCLLPSTFAIHCWQCNSA